VIVDRREAIARAVRHGGPGDAVVIAGKGHETYQVLRDRTIPFDDRQVARQSLRRLGLRSGRLEGAAMACEGRSRSTDVAAATAGGVVSGAPGVRAARRDHRLAPRGAGQLFVAIAGPRFDGHDFVARGGRARRGGGPRAPRRAGPAGLAVVRVADTTRGLADLARARARAGRGPVVCITGSAGKTTTKEMTARCSPRAGRS
jgi:UDP-N-acetylmuramyl tripeptide synthase